MSELTEAQVLERFCLQVETDDPVALYLQLRFGWENGGEEDE